MTQTSQFDAIVIGGGLVGMAQAIALGQEGLTVAVIDRLAEQAQLDDAFDGRVSAVTLASRRILNAIGAWEYMLPHASPIYDIRVTEGEQPGHVHYNYKDAGDEPFGHMVENRYIRHGLFKRLKELDTITLFAPHSAESIHTGSEWAGVTLDDGHVLKAPLALAADGRQSATRKQIGIKHKDIAYGQCALVCSVKHSLPHNGLALEKFLPDGPFAVLPMTEDRSAIVWTVEADMREHYLGLSEEVFLAELKRRLGDYLGDIELCGPRYGYPLQLMIAAEYAGERVALIGDSAHAIHPIAGQGVNLGYRDVAVITDLILKQAKLGMDIGSPQLLAHYQRLRRGDVTSMSMATDVLNRLFSNNIKPFRIAREAGLAMVNRMPRLKGFFMQHAMGMTGTLPPMMRDDEAA